MCRRKFYLIFQDFKGKGNIEISIALPHSKVVILEQDVRYEIKKIPSILVIKISTFYPFID